MRIRVEVVKEGAKISRIIMWLLYLCIKPETSKNVMKVFPCHCKSTKFFRISHVSCENFGKSCFVARVTIGIDNIP